MACGNITIPHGLSAGQAQAQGAFLLDRLNGFQPAAEGLRHIAAAQERQPYHAAYRRVGLYPNFGQAVVDKKQLDEQRCIAAQFYVSRHDLPQHRHLLVLDGRAQQPHRCGQCRTAQPQPQCQPQGLPVQRQHLHHKFPVQLLHRLSRNFGKTKSRGLLQAPGRNGSYPHILRCVQALYSILKAPGHLGCPGVQYATTRGSAMAHYAVACHCVILPSGSICFGMLAR